MQQHTSLGDRAVAIASALAILMVMAFGGEPAVDAHPQPNVATAHDAAR
jgi:hypothetical protein